MKVLSDSQLQYPLTTINFVKRFVSSVFKPIWYCKHLSAITERSSVLDNLSLVVSGIGSNHALYNDFIVIFSPLLVLRSSLDEGRANKIKHDSHPGE